MVSYMCVIQTKSVSVIVFEIIAIKALFDLSRSKVKSSKTYVVSLKPWSKHSCIKWRWFKHQKAKIENLTFQGHSRSRSRSSQKLILIVLIWMYDYHINISNILRDTASRISCKFEFDLSGSSKVKFYCTKRKLIHDFLYPYNWNQVRISFFELFGKISPISISKGEVNFVLCRVN